MNMFSAELIAHLVITCAPLIVIFTIARGEAITDVTRRVRLSSGIVAATAALAIVVTVIDFMRPHTIAGMIAACLSFAVLFISASWPALRQVESEARTEHSSDPGPVRTASLTRRSATDVLPIPLRLLPPALLVAVTPMAALLLYRSSIPRPHLILGLGFFAAAVTFYFLYETWIREEGRGHDRERRLRAIASWQVTLVVAFGLLSIAILSVHAPFALVAGVALGAPLGIAGCAYALLSGASPTRFRAADR